jgi:hypothetical protein
MVSVGSSTGGTTALACINTLRKLSAHPLMIYNDCLQSESACIDNRFAYSRNGFHSVLHCTFNGCRVDFM